MLHMYKHAYVNVSDFTSGIQYDFGPLTGPDSDRDQSLGSSILGGPSMMKMYENSEVATRLTQ